MTRCVHFIGFRGEEYWSAVKVFGRPHFIHMGWDRRAAREIDDDDIVVFANGHGEAPPRMRNYPDLVEEVVREIDLPAPTGQPSLF